MVTKKLLSFLLGAILASAWWQAAVFSYGNNGNDQWRIAIVVTVFAIIIIAKNCVDHIDEK